jgi:hypothetical protein
MRLLRSSALMWSTSSIESICTIRLKKIGKDLDYKIWSKSAKWLSSYDVTQISILFKYLENSRILGN